MIKKPGLSQTMLAAVFCALGWTSPGAARPADAEPVAPGQEQAPATVPAVPQFGYATPDTAAPQPADRESMAMRFLQSAVILQTKEGRELWRGMLIKDPSLLVGTAWNSVPTGADLLAVLYDGREISTRARQVLRFPAGSAFAGLQLVKLEQELPAPALALQEQAPMLGQRLWLLDEAHPGFVPRMKDTDQQTAHDPVARSSSMLLLASVAALDQDAFYTLPQIQPASPVLDQQGLLLGVTTRRGRVVLARPLIASLADRRDQDLPGPVTSDGATTATTETPEDAFYDNSGGPACFAFQGGFRVGGTWGGFVEPGHGALQLRLDLGAVLFEQVGLFLGLGMNAHAGVHHKSIEPEAGQGPGVISAYGAELVLDLELKYIWHIAGHGDRKDFALHLAAGMHTSQIFYAPNGQAVISTEPGCDPSDQACPVTFKDPDPYLERLQDGAIGASFGIDLVLEYLLLGYRFVPGELAWNTGDRHMVHVGTWF